MFGATTTRITLYPTKGQVRNKISSLQPVHKLIQKLQPLCTDKIRYNMANCVNCPTSQDSLQIT
jgi:hypothetical protein